MDFKHLSRNHASFSVQHRDCRARNEEVLLHDPVHCEGLFRKFYDPVRIYLAVSFRGSKSKFKSAARLQSGYVRLELVEERPCPVNVVERLFLCGPVYNFPVHFELIAELHHLVVFNFHCIFPFAIVSQYIFLSVVIIPLIEAIMIRIMCHYALKSTPSNASVGICHLVQARASLPAARRLFQRDIMFPVMTISRTG